VIRYVIVGAGAIGGGIGARLAATGRDVVLVARGEHLAAIQSRGLRLRTPEDDLRLPIPAVADVTGVDLRPADVLVLATKTQQALDVLPRWADAPVAGGGTAGDRLPILTALNGVASESMALRYFRRVYGVCVWMWAVHVAPGEVILRGRPTAGMFHVGRVPARSRDAMDDRLLKQLADDWSAAKLQVRCPDDVMPWKYRKLISNLGNAFQALSGRSDGLGALIRLAEAEARAALAAAGVPVTPDAEEAAARAESFEIAPVPGEPGFVGGSTWQSLSRGTGNVETDYLNGEIVRIAREHGLEAPVNAAVARLTRAAAAGGAAAGSMPVEELRKRLGPPATATSPALSTP
jgi:2-dehydropantoate 2-reductase